MNLTQVIQGTYKQRPYSSPGTWYEGDRPCIANYPQFLLRVSRHLDFLTPKLRFSFRSRK